MDVFKLWELILENQIISGLILAAIIGLFTILKKRLTKKKPDEKIKEPVPVVITEDKTKQVSEDTEHQYTSSTPIVGLANLNILYILFLIN